MLVLNGRCWAHIGPSESDPIGMNADCRSSCGAERYCPELMFGLPDFFSRPVQTRAWLLESLHLLSAVRHFIPSAHDRTLYALCRVGGVWIGICLAAGVCSCRYLCPCLRGLTSLWRHVRLSSCHDAASVSGAANALIRATSKAPPRSARQIDRKRAVAPDQSHRSRQLEHRHVT